MTGWLTVYYIWLPNDDTCHFLQPDWFCDHRISSNTPQFDHIWIQGVNAENVLSQLILELFSAFTLYFRKISSSTFYTFPHFLMSQSIPTGYIPPGNPQGLAQKTFLGGRDLTFESCPGAGNSTRTGILWKMKVKLQENSVDQIFTGENKNKLNF